MHVLRVLSCLRILMRDSHLLTRFDAQGGVRLLGAHLRTVASEHLNYALSTSDRETIGSSPLATHILKEMTSTFFCFVAICCCCLFVVNMKNW